MHTVATRSMRLPRNLDLARTERRGFAVLIRASNTEMKYECVGLGYLIDTFSSSPFSDINHCDERAVAYRCYVKQETTRFHVPSISTSKSVNLL